MSINDPVVQRISVSNQAIQKASSNIDADSLILDGAITGYQETINALNDQISQMTGRKPVIYAGLQSYNLFTKDQKIPFQWIQAGNSGNSGGSSPLPHGTCTWAATPGQPTLIGVKPVNISPKSDNFFFYMVLPYPTLPPMRMRFGSGNYAAKSPADWAKSQQMEFQTEFKGGGYQYTNGWRISPTLGLGYFDKLNETWKQFLVNGKPVLQNMGTSTNWLAECSMDTTKHTITFEWIVVENQFYKVGATLAANTISSAEKEFSVSVQLDCQANALPYSAVLDALTAEWQ